MRGRFIDLTGERFGRLVVVQKTETIKKRKAYKTYWKCKCDCGNDCIVESNALRTGNTKSCGCLNREIVTERAKTLRKTHGKSKERLYKVWSSMRKRCENKNCKRYPSYGGRGITVCDEWKDFETFYAWAMENGYDKQAKKHECTLDRVDNDGGYNPENCRFVSNREQANNKRTNIHITHNGETLTAAQWSRRLGGRKTIVGQRIRNGWEPERAVTQPVRELHYKAKAEGGRNGRQRVLEAGCRNGGRAFEHGD